MFYNPRIPNGGWGITLCDQYQGPAEEKYPCNLKSYWAAGISDGRIRQHITQWRETTEFILERGYLEQKFGNGKGITPHIGKVRTGRYKEI